MASHTVLARRLGWSDDQINNLADFEDRSDFTEREKVALRLAEKMTLDSNGVDDAQWTQLRSRSDHDIQNIRTGCWQFASPSGNGLHIPKIVAAG